LTARGWCGIIPGMIFTAQIEIAAPIHDVFAFLANKHRLDRPRRSLVPRLDKLTEGPVDVGTEFTEEVRMFPGVIGTIRSVITNYDRDRALAETFSGAGLEGTLRYRFEPCPAGTRLTQVQDVRFRGPFRVFGPILPVFGIAMRWRLRAIKAEVEAKSASA